MTLTLKNLSKTFWIVSGISLIALIGFIDYLTGPEMAFSFFYLLPISMTAWFAGKQLGIVMSIACAIVWFIADVASGQRYSFHFIFYWNTVLRLGFFLVVAFLLSSLKTVIEREKVLSRTDSLTDAVNSRYFVELAQKEINRSLRYEHPFTVVYLDLDNFKTVNDRFGHRMGDKVLCTVVSTFKKHLRSIDVVCRAGGDEFILLFPETEQHGARVAISKIQKSLLNEMHDNNWPVTFSIGVMTYITSPQTVDEMIKRADDLMYSVKNSNKNAIAYSVYVAEPLKTPNLAFKEP